MCSMPLFTCLSFYASHSIQGKGQRGSVKKSRPTSFMSFFTFLSFSKCTLHPKGVSENLTTHIFHVFLHCSVFLQVHPPPKGGKRKSDNTYLSCLSSLFCLSPSAPSTQRG